MSRHVVGGPVFTLKMFPPSLHVWDLDPHPTHSSLGLLESTSKRHLDRCSHFCTAHGRESLYFTMGRPFPSKNCRFAWGSGPTLIHCSFGSPESTSRTASRDRFSRFARLTVVTDRPRYSVRSNRPHLPSAAMRPKTYKFTYIRL